MLRLLVSWAAVSPSPSPPPQAQVDAPMSELTYKNIEQYEPVDAGPQDAPELGKEQLDMDTPPNLPQRRWGGSVLVLSAQGNCVLGGRGRCLRHLGFVCVCV